MLIIDFDGTIVDVWVRYFRVFQDFWDIPGFSLKDYKVLKKRLSVDECILRNLMSESIINKRIKDYQKFKKITLESEKYLELDKLILDTSLLNNNRDFIVLTNRRNKESFKYQLIKLGIYDLLYANSIILNPDNGITKAMWLRSFLSKRENKISPIKVVGDSEADLEMSNIPYTEVYLVTTGLRDAEQLISKGKKRTNLFLIYDVNYFLQTCLNN